MTDSYAYAIDPSVGDTKLLDGVERIRGILDQFREVAPSSVDGGPRSYLKKYHDMQNCYAAAITESRRRGLPIPTWPGDELFYSPLAQAWLSMDSGHYD